MAKSREPAGQPLKAAVLSVEDCQKALLKIDRRIADLEGFDTSVLTKRFDSRLSDLALLVNNTLRDIFGADTNEYKDFSIAGLDAGGMVVRMNSYPDPASVVQGHAKRGIERAVGRLNTLKQVLQERIDDSAEQVVMAAPEHAPITSRKVFLVHGHDQGAKEMVARLLEKLSLDVVVLHEQPDGGRSIIEKFERHTDDVAFAVVLFTPDDVGYRAGHQDEARPRPRQNVLYELGYFVGRLTRQRVCVLHTGDVEVPSDYLNVLFTAIDTGGAWRLLLARELTEAGIEVDFRKAI
ncbi:nucleotide-binding protein [Luteibacter sp. ME-Dv--P-043b]|uniref:nucleotide-binding protein n=1 Tax=Luteibacter sp. ME-Dv--P-043b TaxID=3040291 RepID=UPI00255536FC|nr:nucleotide-binding protein [Luteibacter sp. ME-Dv--P-043b]